jgi:hypothetical protein
MLGYALFDHRGGVHRLWRAKVVKVEATSGHPVLEAKARALELALVDLKERGWLPIMVQFDNRNLLEALEKNLSYNNELVDDIIRRCNHIMKHNHIKAIWDV